MSIENSLLIDEFKVQFGMNFDADVAATLSIDSAALRAWRAERRPIPLDVKFRLLQHISYTENIEKIAAAFVDIQKHNELITVEQKKILRIQRSKGFDFQFAKRGINFQIELLQKIESLNDAETAKRLFVSEKQILDTINNGNSFPLVGRLHLNAFLYYHKINISLLDALPISDLVKESILAKDIKIINNNIKSRK